MNSPTFLRFFLAFLFASLSNTAPDAAPDALPDPEADPQTYTNNAPFSGAIYIVNPNGQQVSAQGANYCPTYASQSCSTMGQPSWCCPTGYTCASPANSNGLIGCCPSGSTCGGSVAAAAITTVTVVITSTVSPVYVQQTSVVYVQPTSAVVVVAATTAAGGAYNPNGPYCSTLTETGPGLPTARQGQCGTILVVNGGRSVRGFGYGMAGAIAFLNLALGRMFRWGLW